MNLSSFQQIYDEHFWFVWRSLRRLGVVEADLSDATQDVFLVVYRRFAEFEHRAKVTTWLFRICFRVAKDRSRRAHRWREVLDSAPGELDVAGDAAPGDALERRQALALFEAAIEELDLDQRAVLVSFELEEMSGEEIATALGIPLGTVYSRLRLARAAFRKAVLKRVGQRSPRAQQMESR